VFVGRLGLSLSVLVFLVSIILLPPPLPPPRAPARRLRVVKNFPQVQGEA
jgi:hypothetical protein